MPNSERLAQCTASMLFELYLASQVLYPSSAGVTVVSGTSVTQVPTDSTSRYPATTITALLATRSSNPHPKVAE